MMDDAVHKAERAPEGNKQRHGDAPAPVREQTDEAREPGSPEQREEQRRAGTAFRKAAFQKSGTKNEVQEDQAQEKRAKAWNMKGFLGIAIHVGTIRFFLYFARIFTVYHKPVRVLCSETG